MTSQAVPVKVNAEPMSTASGSRLAYIDNIRALMIILVVLVHAAVTYSGIGGFYYIENKSIDTVSTVIFALFQSFTQAYFLGMLFMISGYFIPRSLEKRGGRAFVSSKLFRLGVPSLVFMFILTPVTMKIVSPELALGQFYLEGLRSLDFLAWNGPLWFALALLFFSVAYAAVKPLTARYAPPFNMAATTQNVILLVSIITVFAFGIRLVFPIGSSFYNFQFSFFASYIVMFVVGVMGYKQDIFNKIDHPTGKRWLIASLALGLPAWIATIVFGGALDGILLFQGGLNWVALAYAAWESFFCVAFIVGLIGMFKKHMNTQGSIAKVLSDNSFGVYVFHAPILVGISIMLKELALHPLAKWALVAGLAVPASFIATHAIRKIRVFGQIFS